MNIPRMRIGELYDVWFDDIAQDPTWKGSEQRMSEETDPCRCFGVFHFQDDDFLHMCSMVHPSGTDDTKIPKGCIREVYKMKSDYDVGPHWKRKKHGKRT